MMNDGGFELEFVAGAWGERLPNGCWQRIR
jgi:hypothetical protein